MNRPRHRSRSISTTFPLVQPKVHFDPLTVSPLPIHRADDLEMVLYRQDKQRKELVAPLEALETWLNNQLDRADRCKSLRENPTIREYLDTMIEFEQEARHLRTALSEHHLLEEHGMDEATASLHRAATALLGAGWCVYRFVELGILHAKAPTEDRELFCTTLGKMVDVGKLVAEVDCHLFWQRVHTHFEAYLDELKQELKRTCWAVDRLDRSRNPAFVAQLEADELALGKNYRIPGYLRNLPPTTIPRLDIMSAMMSGALPIDMTPPPRPRRP